MIVRDYFPVLRSPHPSDAARFTGSRDRSGVPVTAVSEAPTATREQQSHPSGVVVTGAAQGLGKAIARRFAEDGGAVVGLDLNDGVTAVARELGEGHDAVVGDATDPHALRRACAPPAAPGGGP